MDDRVEVFLSPLDGNTKGKEHDEEGTKVRVGEDLELSSGTGTNEDESGEDLKAQPLNDPHDPVHRVLHSHHPHS